MARRALGPATLAVVQAVDAALTPADARLLVACSGGADSLALAAAARHVAERRGLPCAAVVVDHRLQDGSDAVAARAAHAVRGLGLPDVAVVAVTVGTRGGPEAAARDARHAALRSAAAGAPPATVLLGHTRDDQAESVLLGLARGSGPRSLAGMAVRTGGLLRPLLDLPRTTTEQACAELGLVPWSDPHNVDSRFARVRVRRQVLPVLEEALGPGVGAALARTARLARDDADLLDALAAEADPGTDTLDCAGLAVLPAALRSRVLRRWLAGRGAEDVGAEHVQGVDALVTAWHGQRGVDLRGGTVARREGRLLWQAVGRG
ncbi:tRNA(Ile)-lysidine synthase [Friedmanniella luteola]|uniref:tRNA(Ile)-lysidine synthase n=1 Tax=Friedmanniella luteola TaxID=546871 RepID=A0A1H1LS72_9ACTN|nr:tRNA lysidine(34) synthetase TilS [Friedmanniella luteola]SDR76629.1 tRNA(Ile)-lysidine synthase [Friedmanniella luteola]